MTTADAEIDAEIAANPEIHGIEYKRVWRGSGSARERVAYTDAGLVIATHGVPGAYTLPDRRALEKFRGRPA